MNPLPDGMTFDPETHTYRINGQPVPGVTGALAECGLIDARWFDAFSRERGSAVHDYLSIYDRGRLDESEVDPIIEPYLHAYKTFRADTGFQPDPEWIERFIANLEYGFCGRLDRVGILGGRTVLLDFKTGSIQDHIGLQLAGYALCVPGVQGRFALRLTGEGTYALREFRSPLDRIDFLACVHVARLRMRLGVAEIGGPECLPF